MSEAWTWAYEDADGQPMTGGLLSTADFPSQSDAENWFGEIWRDLAAAGVAGVTLSRDGVPVYGPMSLEP
jgi:hypothetical protein